MGKQSVIQVTGAARLSVAPDYNRIQIEIERNYPTNDKAYEAAKANNLAIIAALESVGLDGALAKTRRFTIREHVETYVKPDNFFDDEEL